MPSVQVPSGGRDLLGHRQAVDGLVDDFPILQLSSVRGLLSSGNGCSNATCGVEIIDLAGVMEVQALPSSQLIS